MRGGRDVSPVLVRLARRFAAQVFRPTAEEEVDEEFRFHIEMEIKESLEEGLTRDEAERRAIARFGDLKSVREACIASRQRRDGKMAWQDRLGDLGQDLRFAARQIRKSPGFATVAVITLALGIGANTAVFSVVSGVLLEPLAYAQPDRLVRVWARFLPESGYTGERFSVSPAEAIDYREYSTLVESVGYYRLDGATLTGDGAEPQRAQVARISHDMLPMLGTPPEVGRWFTEEEDLPGGPPAVILSHSLWTSRYSAEPGIVGRIITVDGEPREVVGVMPRSFRLPERADDLYLPFQLNEDSPGGKANHSVQSIARLSGGVTHDQAGAELRTLTSAWREEFGHPQLGHQIYVEGLREAVVGDVRRALWMLMATVGLVLLIASANVANLLLARGETRMQEVALRTALGAGRGRLLRQLLTESLVLSGLGAVLGIGIALAGLKAATYIDPSALPRSEEIGLNSTVLAFTALVALATALLFGLAPALQSTRVGGSWVVAESRTAGSRRGTHVRRALVSAEVALSVVVVVSAGLVVKSFTQLMGVDPGLETAGRLSFSIQLPRADYPTGPDRANVLGRIIEQAAAVPGVTDVAFVSNLPMSSSVWLPDFRIQGRASPVAGERNQSASLLVTTPGYMRTLGIQVVAGREFSASDDIGAEMVALVSRETVRLYWPDGDVLGSRLGFGGADVDLPWMTVVGIVDDTPTGGPDDALRPQIYVPLAQAEASLGGTLAGGSIVVKASVDPSSVVTGLRGAVASVDSALPLASLTTLDDVVRSVTARPRLASGLLGSFAFIAFLLAVVGVYGVVAYSVARRTREIGIRLALGADRGRVVGLIVREGAAPAVLGVALGVPGALAATSLLRGLLFGVSPTDPATFILLPGALILVSLLASWMPARASTRITPVEALRD